MSYFVEDQEEENERFAETIQALRRQVRTLTAERDEARAEEERYLIEARDSARVAGRYARERDEARAEVVRLGKQVQQAQHAHDGLVNLLADGKTIAASDLSHLFDALFPKWSETS